MAEGMYQVSIYHCILCCGHAKKLLVLYGIMDRLHRLSQLLVPLLPNTHFLLLLLFIYQQETILIANDL